MCYIEFKFVFPFVQLLREVERKALCVVSERKIPVSFLPFLRGLKP